MGLFPTKDGLKPVVYCGPFFVITNEKLEIDSICELMSKRTRKDSKNYKLKAEAIEITNLQMSNLLFK